MKQATRDGFVAVFAVAFSLVITAGFVYFVWRYGPRLVTWAFMLVNVQPGEVAKRVVLGVLGAAGTAAGTAGAAYIRRTILLSAIARRVAVLIAVVRALGDADLQLNDIASQINADVSALLFKQQELDRVVKFVEPSEALVVLQAVAAMGRLSQATTVEARSDALIFLKTLDLDPVLRALLDQAPMETTSTESLRAVLSKHN